MPSPWLYALTVGPLGFYLWCLGLWQSDRHPRVVSGLLDHTLLCLGVGGIVAFGPFGQFVARALFGKPDAFDWLALVSGLGLCATLLARRALSRLVVYHVDPSSLAEALGDVLATLDGEFARTLSGYEDRVSRRGLVLDFTPWLRSAVVEAYGKESDQLIRAIRPKLAERLRGVRVGPSRVGAALYGMSLVVMIVPLVGLFLSQPKAREALRVLLERLRGV